MNELLRLHVAHHANRYNLIDGQYQDDLDLGMLAAHLVADHDCNPKTIFAAMRRDFSAAHRKLPSDLDKLAKRFGA